MEATQNLRMTTFGPASTRTSARIFDFLASLGPGALMEESLGAVACSRCGSTGPAGALSLVVDLRREHVRCPECDLATDGCGQGFGRRLPSGRVVLDEVVVIER